jgi:hypothetical protein
MANDAVLFTQVGYKLAYEISKLFTHELVYEILFDAKD